MNTNEIKDGGPAFPSTAPYIPQQVVTSGDQGWYPHYLSSSPPATISYPGMSLRDWFAGQALPVILQRWMDRAEIEGNPTKAAYQVADDMLKAREASNE